MRAIKLSLAAASAVVVLFALVGVASANRLSVSSQTMRVSWSAAELTGGFGTTSCAFSLEGSMHTATTTKTAGALLGYITRASVGFCSIGSATVLTATLPWHVQYRSFTGVLPNIASILTNIIGAKWLIREPVFALSCLFTSTVSSPNTATFNLSSGSVESVRLGGTIPSDCGINGLASGTSNSSSGLTIRLI